MKKLFLWAAFTVLLGACSAAPNIPSQDTGSLVPIDTSAEAQALFKAEWLKQTGNKVFSGDFSFASTSKSTTYTCFDASGNMFNSFGSTAPSSGSSWFPMYRILKYKSGTEALVTYFKAAVAPIPLYKEVYALEIRGDKLYRTEIIDPSIGKAGGLVGFISFDNWDGKSYGTKGLSFFAEKTADTFYAPTRPAPAE